MIFRIWACVPSSNEVICRRSSTSDVSISSSPSRMVFQNVPVCLNRTTCNGPVLRALLGPENATELRQADGTGSCFPSDSSVMDVRFAQQWSISGAIVGTHRSRITRTQCSAHHLSKCRPKLLPSNQPTATVSSDSPSLQPPKIPSSLPSVADVSDSHSSGPSAAPSLVHVSTVRESQEPSAASTTSVSADQRSVP